MTWAAKHVVSTLSSIDVPTVGRIMNLTKSRLLDQRSQHRLLDRHTALLRRALSKEFERLSLLPVTVWMNEETMTAAIATHKRNVFALLTEANTRGANAAADRAIGTLMIRQSKKLDTLSQLLRRMSQWAYATFSTRAMASASSISRTTLAILAGTVEQGIVNRESPAEVSRHIRAHIANMEKTRADTIARTEMHQAMMSGQQEAMEITSEEFDLALNKVWVSTADERTRPTHVEANGQIAKLDGTFIVGGAVLSYPGDPDGPPGEVINCRCTLTYEEK